MMLLLQSFSASYTGWESGGAVTSALIIVDKATALRRAAQGLTDSDIRGDEYMKKANNEDGLT